MAKLLEYNATLARRIDVTDALAIFQFEPDESLPTAPWFVPGQYMVLGLNNEASPELGQVQRPMSIASASESRDHVEFYIRYVSHPASKNPLTHLLWQLQEGQRGYIRAVPKGKFTVPDLVGDDDPRLKVFVGAGTGLAPFLSIVRSHHLSAPGDPLDRYAIIHGASYPADLGYRDELEQFSRAHGLHYVPTVSRPQEAKDWRGSVGRAEDLFLPERLAELEGRLGLEAGGLAPDRAVIFVCGLQGTIGKSIERLTGRGFVPDHRGMRQALEVPEDVPASLFYEQYDKDPVIDLKDEALVDRLRGELRAALT